MSERKPSLSDLRIDDHARYGGSGRPGIWLLVSILVVAAAAAAWFWFRAPRAVPVRVATVVEAPANPSGAGPVLLDIIKGSNVMVGFDYSHPWKRK